MLDVVQVSCDLKIGAAALCILYLGVCENFAMTSKFVRVRISLTHKLSMRSSATTISA
jgi:hypothetical protein